VARALDHDLHAVAPGALGQLADRGELGELRLVGRVGEPAGAEPVADGERDIVRAHDLADVVPMLVHRVLFVVGEHPLGEQRAAPETMPIRRSFTSGMCRLRTPAWRVM
jgi:hypothetical protein